MWNLIETLFVLVCVVGCGTAPPAESTVGQIVSNPSPETTPGVAQNPLTTPNPNPSTSPSSIPDVLHLTYYTLTKTIASVTSGGTTTNTHGTGGCITYLAKTYCWDDGVKAVTLSFSVTYFGVNQNVQHCIDMSNGCTTDLFTQPTLITNNLINLPMKRFATEVLSSGTAVPVDCTDDGNGTLDCTPFRIDLNQIPI